MDYLQQIMVDVQVYTHMLHSFWQFVDVSLRSRRFKYGWLQYDGEQQIAMLVLLRSHQVIA